MECLNYEKLLGKDEIVPMGQLIETMLMGHDCGPLDQVPRLQYEAQEDLFGLIDEDKLSDPRANNHGNVFCVNSFFLGFIASTGPSTRAIVAQMDAVSVWKRLLLIHFPNNLGIAAYQSNALLRNILDSNRATMDNLCFGHVSTVRWRPDWSRRHGDYKPLWDEVTSGRATQRPTIEAIVSEEDISQLIQLRESNLGQLPRKMGIASPQARPGDLVYSIPGVKHCVTVRISSVTDSWTVRNVRLQIFGTSLLVKDVADVPFDNPEQSLHGREEIKDDNTSLPSELKMDPLTIFALIS